jgi:hypothetical protein
MRGPPAEILAGDKFLTGGSGKVGSDGFLDLAGAEAARTDTDLLHRSLVEGADPLQVRIPPASRLVVGMAHIVTEPRTFSADFAHFCHLFHLR